MLPSYKNLKLRTLYENQILLITISRPYAKNSFNTETAYELAETIKYFNDSQHKVAILIGEGDTFCAGADLKELGQISSAEEVSAKLMSRLRDYGIGGMGPTKMIALKPIIAAVRGYAVAGGLELATWCDMIVSHKDAVFGVFCRRFSVPLIDGGTIRLARIVGYSRAMDMILTGRAIKGTEAYSWGLVNRITDKAEDVLNEAEKLAKLLCDLPQECMRSDRLSTIESVYGNLERDLRNETRLGLKTIMTGASIEGAKRFINKEGKHGAEVLEKKNILDRSKL